MNTTFKISLNMLLQIDFDFEKMFLQKINAILFKYFISYILKLLMTIAKILNVKKIYN